MSLLQIEAQDLIQRLSECGEYKHRFLYLTSTMENGKAWCLSCENTNEFITRKLLNIPDSITFQINCAYPGTPEGETQKQIVAGLIKDGRAIHIPAIYDLSCPRPENLLSLRNLDKFLENYEQLQFVKLLFQSNKM